MLNPIQTTKYTEAHVNIDRISIFFLKREKKKDDWFLVSFFLLLLWLSLSSFERRGNSVAGTQSPTALNL